MTDGTTELSDGRTSSGDRVFSDNAAAKRYELRIDGELLASVEYAENPHSVSITRVFTRPTHRGQGLAAEITEYAADRIVAAGKTVVPICSYAVAWFAHHPERRDQLSAR